MKKRLIPLTICVALIVSLIPVAILAETPPASLEASYKGASGWAVPELDKAAGYGLITDRVKDNMAGNISREEFAEIAVRLYEVYSGKKAEAGSITFSDTTNPEILKAANLGMVMGIGEGKFGPTLLVTREQMATILLRTLKVINPAADFSVTAADKFGDDEKIAGWAKDGVYYCFKAGIIKGIGNNMYGPQNNSAREAAIIVCTRGYELYKQAGSTEATGQNINVSTEKPVDDNLTLASVKKAAQDMGYTVEDIQDLKQRIEPNPINGFRVNYKDEHSESQNPVFEFLNSTDAQTYAKQVNETGYNLCIINEKLVTMIWSKYGVALNDNEKAVFETLLKSKVMVYEEPVLTWTNYNKDYAGASSRIDVIQKALDRLVNKSVLMHVKSLPGGDTRNIGTISFSMVSSPDLSFTSTLCEDQTKTDEVVKTWEYFGCTDVKLKHDIANDYTLSGKRAGMDDPFTIRCIYNPDKDSLRIVDYNGGELVELFEFVPLGGDKYAFQTLHERAIVEYKDGKITSFTYSLNKRTKEKAYNPDTDSIFPNGTGIDKAWASKSGENGYEQFITFDGAKLQISAVDFTGDKLKDEIDILN
jgi:hypothetical protein